MPKKTRQQKMLADVRRNERQDSPHFIFTTAPATSAVVLSTLSGQAEPDYLVKKDLLKTLIISAFFIVSEVLLALFSKKLGW